MAKKLKFRLKMREGIEVKTLEQLQEQFYLPKIFEYILNKKLITWLEDRELDEYSNVIKEINLNSPDVVKNICSIFKINWNDEFEKYNLKIKNLQQYNADTTYYPLIEKIAFNDEDLNTLIESENEIYLCGEEFIIPLNKTEVTYISVNNPIVKTNLGEKIDWNNNEIKLSDVNFKDKVTEKEIIEESKSNNYTKTYLNFMLNNEQKENAKKTYEKIIREVNSIVFDDDSKMKKLKEEIEKTNFIEVASNYIKNL